MSGVVIGGWIWQISLSPVMSSLFYALNIATLAIWSSVAGFGVLGWMIPIWRLEPKSSRDGETAAFLPNPEISLGSPEESTGAPTPLQDTPETMEAEVMPAPPEIPEISEFSPLPEMPVLLPKRPAPAAKIEKNPAVAVPTKRVAVGRPKPNASSTAGGDASGISASARLASGQMPAPTYPAEARNKGQSGTVLVEFMVGTNGRVISAYPKDPSPWPLLNNEAVRTVRRWKFPPGAAMKLQRPIVFQLK